MTSCPHNPGFVDWDAYMAAHYTPAPALTGLPDYDSFWRTLGGRGWGFDGAIERERIAREAELRNCAKSQTDI